MKIFLSTKHPLDNPCGSSVIAMRHARMLAEKGHNIVIICPDKFQKEQTINGINIIYYKFDEKHNFLYNRVNISGQKFLKAYFIKNKPDIVYDVHGPLWAIEEASNQNIPVFSMVGDYNHLCLLNFLVTPLLKRCNGPTDFQKCNHCIRKGQHFKTRSASLFFKNKYFNSITGHILGSERAERWNFQDAAFEAFQMNKGIRDKVNYYIIGDKHSESVFTHFIDPEKIIFNQQFLSSEIHNKIKSNIKVNKNPDLIIGYVGRLDHIKGFPNLIRAFLEIGDYSNIELWVVHKFDAGFDKIKACVKNQNKIKYLIQNNKIKCFNPTDEDALFKLMSDFSIGIIPSLAFETPNLVLMELIACEIPVIRSESDGMVHLIQNNYNGLTYKYDSYKELGNRIEYIIDNPKVLSEWKSKLPVLRNEDDYYKNLNPYFESVK